MQATAKPSVISALRSGFKDLETYYGCLESYGGAQGAFFDSFLGGNVVTSYKLCQEIYKLPSIFGRSRLTLPDSIFEECTEDRVFSGYRLLKTMSIFQNVDESYAQRRQRLLGVLGKCKRKGAMDLVGDIASQHVQLIPASEEVDLFSTSLRAFASQCASVAVFGDDSCPPDVVTDALSLANFLDGKRLAKSHTLEAFAATDRLGDWITGKYACSHQDSRDLVADLVLLFVAAHESMSFLIYTCLRNIQDFETLSGTLDAERWSNLANEGMRFDSPIQLGGRVVLSDFKLGNLDFRSGDKIFLHLGMANRDPLVFESPHIFLEGRSAPHLSFGWGPTRCVGSDYATLCSIAYLGALANRFKTVTCNSDQTVFDHGISARGLKKATFNFSS